jgi:hypothetical protein
MKQTKLQKCNSRERMSPPFMVALISGAAAGMAGGWAMTRFTKLWNNLSGFEAEPLPYSAQEWDATSRIAQLCITCVSDRKPSKKGLKAGAAIVHYAIAAGAGAGYETLMRSGVADIRWSGTLAGIAMWLIGNELLAALGLITPGDYSFAMRANSLGEHIAYGLTTDLICRRLR